MATFFIILIIILILAIAITTIPIKVHIEKLEIMNKSIEDIEMAISFGWLKIKLEKEKIDKILNNKKIEALIEKIKERIKKDYNTKRKIAVKDIKEFLRKIAIEELKLNAVIGTTDIFITTFLVTITSIIIPFLIVKNAENPEYEIAPRYIEENYLKLSIKCIISVKLVHIINIAKELERNDRGKKDGRSSNRGPYANSNG